jgi:alpha-N-arabinofuranosidase
VFWGKQWNDTLIKGAGPLLGTITDHPLIGGTVSPAADPLDVYRDFMAVPQVLEQKWAELRRQMEKAGLEQPRLAVTELQMFARLGQAGGSATARLTHENLVNPSTLAEALYDVLVYHTAVRLAPFVEFVTHSATVNHGGGLHKERERVYAHPCHYAQAAFADFAEATPVAVELESPEESAPLVMPDLKNVTSACNFNAIDALAALSPNGSLLISLVHRGTAGHIRLLVEVRDFSAGAQADLRTLSAPQPWARNSLAQPTAVHPVDSSVEVREGRCELYLQPFTVMRVRIPQRPVQ